jgi:hypothetical protein
MEVLLRIGAVTDGVVDLSFSKPTAWQNRNVLVHSRSYLVEPGLVSDHSLLVTDFLTLMDYCSPHPNSDANNELVMISGLIDQIRKEFSRSKLVLTGLRGLLLYAQNLLRHGHKSGQDLDRLAIKDYLVKISTMVTLVIPLM